MSEEVFLDRINQCVTKFDLMRLFSFAELLDMSRAGFLQKWLAENFSEEAAEILSPDEIVSWSDDELRFALCELLGTDPVALSDYDAYSVERTLNKRHLKEMFAAESEDNGGSIVTNQRELIDALNDGYFVIYLVGGIFQIPLNRSGVIYHGRENALVEIPNRRDVDFDRAEISLNDLQIFVRHNITVRYSKSTNLIFLRGDKIAQYDTVMKIDIYKILRGRRAFEKPENFSHRAEKLRGIVVGKVFLDENDYNINLQLFELKIDWYLDFLSVVRNFAEKFFSCVIPVELARKIYETERAQLVFADFCAIGDRPAIKQLYLRTSDGMRINIFVTDNPAPEAFAEKNQSGSSGGRGYGLELITAN